MIQSVKSKPVSQFKRSNFMSRKKLGIILIGFFLIALNSTILAAEPGSSNIGDKGFYLSAVVISCVFGMAIASSFCGLAQSKAIANAMDAIARQPSAFKDIQTLLIIGLALIESLALYTLVIAIIFIYASPFTSLITK
jgi:F-type H+-transporting ATPase subunit c